MTDVADAPWLPLRGVTVLDFSLLLPGPYATLALADLGADVIKVEPPGGDFARQIPFAMFRMANRNKRSVVLDLKSPASSAVIERLAQRADIAIEGFRPGVAKRLGIDHASLVKINPRIISCSISGYGQSGPDAQEPGHDLNYLAVSGALALAGHWLEPPRRSGIPIADLAAGHHAVIAILAAMHERTKTGKGAWIDIGMSEAAMAYTAIRHGFALDRATRDHLWPTNDLFEAADGRQIALGIVEERFWENYVAAVRDLAPDLASADFDSEPKRRAKGDALSRRMRELMRTRPSDEWMQRFRAHDAPASLVLTPVEAARSEQVRHRQTISELDGEQHITFPVFADGRRGAALRWTAECLGASTLSVLGELGYDESGIARLRSEGALGAGASDQKS